MKNSRLTLDIISIIVSVVASLVFMLPVWHFTTTTTTKETISITPIKVKLFDRNSMNNINHIYNTYNHSLDQKFEIIFQCCCLITMLLVLIFILLTLISIIKKYSHSVKLFKVTKIISICIFIFSLLTLTSALIFTNNSQALIEESSVLKYTLSVNITTGVYVFIVSTIFTGITGYIANNIKEIES